MALLKAIEAGVDGVDTAISSAGATYGNIRPAGASPSRRHAI
jgi:pyruvate/oxaloacetate carboxyltransferase